MQFYSIACSRLTDIQSAPSLKVGLIKEAAHNPKQTNREHNRRPTPMISNVRPVRQPETRRKGRLQNHGCFEFAAMPAITRLVKGSNMLIAMLNGNRSLPRRGLKGVCQSCGGLTIAKCGPVRAHHWAHKPGANCSYTSRPESEWHTQWKRNFPEDWLEVQSVSPDGEKRIADVLTPQGLTVEIQHSPIKPEERNGREKFWSRLVWVVDGNRTQSAEYQFAEMLYNAYPRPVDQVTFEVNYSLCDLTKAWASSKKPVYFEFESMGFWRMAAEKHNSRAFVTLVDKRQFIDACKSGIEPIGVKLKKRSILWFRRPPLKRRQTRPARRDPFHKGWTEEFHTRRGVWK